MILKTKDNIEFEISEEDFEMVNSFVWHKAGNYIRNSKGQWLHRFITNCPKGMVVDHINGDTLDNRLRNLKITTQSENNKNRQDSMYYDATMRNKTGYRGLFIVHDKRGKRYFYRFELKGYKAKNFAISKKQDAIKYALSPIKMEHKEEFDKELLK